MTDIESVVSVNDAVVEQAKAQTYMVGNMAVMALALLAVIFGVNGLRH
jgi:negative regulator of sigma E activity